MNDILLKLDDQLRTRRPEYYAHLQEPLTAAAITALETEYGVTLPADLKELYTWKNGQADSCYKSFVNNSMFIPLQEALSTAKENTGMIGFDFDVKNWWHEQWIPLFHNGGGDYICYDRGGLFTGSPGQLIVFWHTDNDRNVISPDLKTFLAALLHYYEQTPAEKFDGFFSVDEIADGFPKRFNAG